MASAKTMNRWLRVVVSAGLLLWLVRSIAWEMLAAHFADIRWSLVLLACALHAANRLLTTVKWQRLLRAKRIAFPFFSLLRVVWVSNFLGHFLPSVAGGDSVRMFTMARRSDRAPEAVSTVVVERLTGLMSLAALAILGGCWSLGSWNERRILLILACPVAALLIALVLLWTDRGSLLLLGVMGRFQGLPGYRFLAQVHEAVQTFRQERRAVLASLAISFLVQFNRVGLVYCLAKALGIVLFFGEALVLVPTVLFVSMLPISVSGLGLQEGAFVVLLRLAGIETSSAFSLAILSRLSAACSNLPGALWLIADRGLRAPATSTTTPPASPNRHPLTVLHLTDKLGYDGRWHGVGRLLYNVLPTFDPIKVRVVACVLRERNGLDARFRQRGIALSNLQRRKADPRALVDLWRLVRRERVDVLHLHGYGSTTIGRIVGLLAGIPAIIQQHDTDQRFPWYVGLLDKCLAGATSRAIAVSKGVREFCAIRRGIPPERVVVVPTAVPLEEFSSAQSEGNTASPALLAGRPGSRVIGSITRFREEKGVRYLLEAFAKLRATHPHLVLVLAGDGPRRQELEGAARTLGIEEAVQFLGFRDDVSELLRAFELFVLPSITEGLPLALLEAMAAGKPIVASGVGGIPEAITDSVSGRLVPPAQAEPLEQALRELLDDPALARRLGQAAQIASRRFSAQACGERFSALYREVVQERDGRQPMRQPMTPSEQPPGPPPMRVLWVADKLGYGDRLHDVGQCYVTVLPALRGVEVIPAVLRSTNGLARLLQAHGIPLRQFQHSQFDPRTLWRLVRSIRRERIDVLHLHGYGASAFGRLAGWLTRTPAIIHQHDSMSGPPWYARLSDRLLSRWTSRAIAVSESVKQFCIERRSIPHERIVVWHNGVAAARAPADPAHRADLRRRLRIPDGHRVVGTVTRLSIDKGTRCLVEAANRVLERVPGTTFLVIGDGPERPRLEAAALRLGLGGRMRFLGFRSDAAELLGALDCFVLPSVTEGSSFSLLQAMAEGLPIVATAVGGTLDVLRHGHNGWLVPPRDPRALADGIVALLEQPALRRGLGEHARLASRAYDMGYYAERLAAVYREAITARMPRLRGCRLSWVGRFSTLVRYSLVGASGALVHFGILWFLVEILRVPVLVATSLGFVAAVANNFVWNRAWTFESAERNIRLQFTRFAFVSVCGLALNAAGMAVLVSGLRWPYLAAQAATTGIVWWWNFLANTYWTFQPIRFRSPQGARSQYPYALSLVIPAYNEERRLGRTVEAVAAYVRSRRIPSELILVDDGSADRTLEVATRFPAEGLRVRVIHHGVNRGKGAAVRDGLLAAEGEYVLMMDADNAIPIDCLDTFWPLRDERRVLVGSRYHGGRGRQSDVPRLRYWISRSGNRIIRWFLLPGIEDTQCGFKLFSFPIAKALAARQQMTGFGFDMELLAIGRALGVEIREVPVRWMQVPGSRVRPVRDAWRALGELVAIKASLWSGVYHTGQPVATSAATPSTVAAESSPVSA